jgi:hypothetical protein
MTVADVATPGNKVHKALEDLQTAWADTLEHWHDDNSSKFEEDHLVPMALTIRLSLDAVNRMSESLAKAERDCE